MKDKINKIPMMLLLGFSSLTLSYGVFAADTFDVAEQYAKTCAVCHNSGVAGAPKKGDSKAWTQRLTKGNDTLLKNVTQGIGAMPAKGLCTDCNADQFMALIEYMSK